MLERTASLKIQAYPNPFADQLQIATELEQATEYQLIDALGRKLSSGRIEAGVQTITIPTANLPSGRYLVRIGEESLTVIK